MAVPTILSTGNPLRDRFAQVNNAAQSVRLLAANQKAILAVGDTSIHDIVYSIYRPLARSTVESGFWHLITDLSAGKHFRNYYRDQLSKRIEYEPADVNLGPDNIKLDGNTFAITDPVRFVGPGTPPGNIVKGTNYWIEGKIAQRCSFKASEAGAIIDLTAGAAGSCFVELRIAVDLTTLIDAIEAAIDEIIVAVPETAVTLEIRADKFDKALAFSTDGLNSAVLTAAQTATLQTKLQAIVDAVEAPV